MTSQAKPPRKPTTGGILIGSDYDTARTRKMNADAEIAELELARIRGTLCLTDDVVAAWETVLQAAKAKFLGLPTKIAPVLANETDVGIVKDLLEQQLREALTELSNYQPQIDPVRTGAVLSDEPTEAKPAPKKRGRPRKVQAVGK
jgi:hypothetical protein